LLVEDPGKDSSVSSVKATKVELLKALMAWRQGKSRLNLIFRFLLGHGSFDNNDYRFNLVGPDITGSESELN